MAAPQASSRLEMLQARFQQRQLAEKEQKLLQLYDQQQLRAHQVAQRGSAGSNGSNSSAHGNNVDHQRTVARTTIHSTSNSQGGGKVRQMFDERRQTKGIDKSYPLEPLENRSRKHTTATGNVNLPVKNENPMSNRRGIVTRRTVRSEANGGKPTVSHHEEVSREISDSMDQDNEQREEFTDGNFEVSRYENGRIDRSGDRHRTTGKINFTELDHSSATDPTSDNLEKELFPEDEIINAPERLPGPSWAEKKSSRAEARLEQLKNSSTKKIGQTTKQVVGNSFTNKRNETTLHSGSLSRLAKSPSPDIVGTKRSTTRGTTAATSTLGRAVPSSPNAKSPDATNRCGTSEPASPGEGKTLGVTSSRPGSRDQTEFLTNPLDSTDGTATNNSQVIEIVSTITTKINNGASEIHLKDDGVSGSKDDTWNRGKPSVRKRSSERSSTSTPLSRPTSGLSTSCGATSARGVQSSRKNSKSKIMSTKTKSTNSSGPKAGPPSNPRAQPPAATDNDGLAPCKICGRRFNSERVTRHEQICVKTTSKKRKQFDAGIHRVKGTELEPFVKKGGSKKSDQQRKTQKPEVKSNWRRKHEDFINAIRSAKQVQAHLAAGGKLSDLPPPPPSDTSDYVQCPHCGRKFNQAAADRHVPKCQSMMHNKPNPRAPPKPKR